MVTYWFMSRAMRSTDDSEWSVHSLMLSFSELRGILPRHLLKRTILVKSTSSSAKMRPCWTNRQIKLNKSSSVVLLKEFKLKRNPTRRIIKLQRTGVDGRPSQRRHLSGYPNDACASRVLIAWLIIVDSGADILEHSITISRPSKTTTQASRQSTLKTILSRTRKKRPPFSINTSRRFSLQSASIIFPTLDHSSIHGWH